MHCTLSIMHVRIRRTRYLLDGNVHHLLNTDSLFFALVRIPPIQTPVSVFQNNSLDGYHLRSLQRGSWRVHLRGSWGQFLEVSGTQSHFSPSVSKKGGGYRWLKGTPLHIKNMRIKQLCNRKFWDFVMALRTQSFRGFRKTGPWDHLRTRRSPR